MTQHYDAVALFSGGLDSILAIKTLEAQGLKVKSLHFVTPFFGKPQLREHWQNLYGLDLEMVDVSAAFVHMLRERPAHGFGKLINPCVDCKILMMRRACEYMRHYGACCVVSGEVLGQRPMSQRRDTLNSIKRESGLGNALLRPLCARLLEPSDAELSGRVDREKLHAIFGRGRKEQLMLAEHYGIMDIPTPAGGCRLTEQENASRYWHVLSRVPHPEPEDFCLSHTGRQLWSTRNGQGEEVQGKHWLCVGRNAANNEALDALARPGDVHFTMRDFPGPVGLGRQLLPWAEAEQDAAAALVASFAPQALRAADGGKVAVRVRVNGTERIAEVQPERETILRWREPLWIEAKEALRAEARARAEALEEKRHADWAARDILA